MSYLYLSPMQGGYAYLEDIRRAREQYEESLDVRWKIDGPPVYVGKTLILPMEEPENWKYLDDGARSKLKKEFLIKECGHDKVWFEEDRYVRRPSHKIMAFYNSYHALFEVGDAQNTSSQLTDTLILMDWLCKKTRDELEEIAPNELQRLSDAIWRHESAFTDYLMRLRKPQESKLIQRYQLQHEQFEQEKTKERKRQEQTRQIQEQMRLQHIERQEQAARLAQQRQQEQAWHRRHLEARSAMLQNSCQEFLEKDAHTMLTQRPAPTEPQNKPSSRQFSRAHPQTSAQSHNGSIVSSSRIPQPRGQNAQSDLAGASLSLLPSMSRDTTPPTASIHTPDSIPESPNQSELQVLKPTIPGEMPTLDYPSRSSAQAQQQPHTFSHTTLSAPKPGHSSHTKMSSSTRSGYALSGASSTVKTSATLKRSANAMSSDAVETQTTKPQKKRKTSKKTENHTNASAIHQDDLCESNINTSARGSMFDKGIDVGVHPNRSSSQTKLLIHILSHLQPEVILQKQLDQRFPKAPLNLRKAPRKFVEDQHRTSEASKILAAMHHNPPERRRLCKEYGLSGISKVMKEHFDNNTKKFVEVLKLKLEYEVLATGNHTIDGNDIEKALENLSVMLHVKGWSAARFGTVNDAVQDLLRSQFATLFDSRVQNPSMENVDPTTLYALTARSHEGAQHTQTRSLNTISMKYRDHYLPLARRGGAEADARSRETSVNL